MAGATAPRVLRRQVRDGFPTGRIVNTTAGPVFCRVAISDSAAATVLLVHGWSAWSDANWAPVYQPLIDAGWNVLAPDLPGHADGPRVPRFSLEGTADVLAEVCHAVGVSRVVVCGYSMGGPLAMLLRDRHRGLVDGLVLVATSAWFHGGVKDEALFGAARAGIRAAALVPQLLFTRVVAMVLGGTRKLAAALAWMADDVQGHDWPTVLDAACDLARFDFRSRLVGLTDRAVVVITERDRTVPPVRQLALATGLGAVVVPLEADHSAPVSAPTRFAAAVTEAVGMLFPAPTPTRVVYPVG